MELKKKGLFDILKKEKMFILLIFILSFIFQVAFFHLFLRENRDYFRGDSPEYHEVAISVAKGNGILDSKLRPNYYRVPGYSLFLSLCYKIFDFDQEKSIIFQIFISSFIPILVFLLSLVFFPFNVLIAKISSVIMALNFGLILYSGFLMSETIFTIFFLIFCLLFFSSFHMFFCKIKSNSFSYKKIFIAGLILGLASLIRPIGHFFIFVSVVILFLSSLSIKKKLNGSLILFLGWFFIIAFWLVRNFLLTGSVFFHSMPGKHFLFYIATDVKSEITSKSFLQTKLRLKEKYKKIIKDKEIQLNKKLSSFEKCRIAEKIAFNIMVKNPIRTIKWSFINFFKTIFGFHCSVLLDRYSKNFIGYNSLNSIFNKIKCYLFPSVDNKFLIFLVYYEILFLLFFYSGLFGSVINSFFDRELLCLLFKVLPLVALLIFLTLGIGLARLRFPLEPFLTILATNFWVGLLKGREFCNAK